MAADRLGTSARGGAPHRQSSALLPVDTIVAEEHGVSLHHLETVLLREIRESGMDPHSTTIYDLDRRLLRGDRLAAVQWPRHE